MALHNSLGARYYPLTLFGGYVTIEDLQPHAHRSTKPPVSKMSTKEKLADAARKIYNPLGFKKFYNFVLFFIFGGALLGFTLARFQYLSFDHGLCPEGGGTLDWYGLMSTFGIQSV